MNAKLPVRLMIVPPLIAAAVFGVGCGLFSWGITMKDSPAIALQSTSMVTGSGLVIGFLWGSLIWVDKLARIYQPRIYETTSQVPVEKPAPVRVELHQSTSTNYEIDYIDLPAGIKLHQLISVAHILKQNGFHFSHALSGGAQPLQRPQYEALRDVMLAKGLLEWKSSNSRNQGLVLTRPGKAMFNQLATHQEGQPPKLVSLLR